MLTRYTIDAIIRSEGVEMTQNGRTQVELLVHESKRDVKMSINNMEEKHVNILDAANYMILLFHRVNKPYTCIRTKICKLLTIVAFKYARKQQQLFDTVIYEYNGCGCVMSEILETYERDICAHLCYDDDNKPITEPLQSISLLDTELLNKYPIGVTLTDSVKTEIENVFKTFGAYSATQLGTYLNQIVKQNDVTRIDKTINLDVVAKMQRKDLQNVETDTLLIDYLF